MCVLYDQRSSHLEMVVKYASFRDPFMDRSKDLGVGILFNETIEEFDFSQNAV